MPGTQTVDILEVLGNQTRRKILRVLALEPTYLLELAKEVGVSQQAVLKHLTLMEGAGLLSSFRKKSTLGPPRKYYRLKDSMYLTAGIAGDLFEVRIGPIEKAGIEEAPWIEELHQETDRLEGIEDLGERLRRANELLLKIKDQLGRLDDEKVTLLNLSRKVRRIASEAARQASKTDIERRVLYKVMGSSTLPNAELLSVELGVRVGTIEGILKGLKKVLRGRE